MISPKPVTSINITMNFELNGKKRVGEIASLIRTPMLKHLEMQRKDRERTERIQTIVGIVIIGLWMVAVWFASTH